jgi:predicted short-subunit dehydrogenase-like oxidoreductase (DUF2520 family)
MVKLGFIGAGRVGTGLAASLNSKEGYQVVAVYDINPNAAQAFAQKVGCRIAASSQEVADSAEVVFVTTVDSQITPASSEIKWHPGQSAIHCSGANTTELLEPAKKQGAHVGVIHPNCLFHSVEQVIKGLPGTTFDIEAEEPALSTLKDVATALGCYWIETRAEARPVLHVAVEFVSLYLMLLAKLAANLMRDIHIPEERTPGVLFPIIGSVMKSFETLGIGQNLPGPVARYDSGTIKKHIDGVKRTTPALISLYRELALQSIPVVLAEGSINQQQAEELKKLLQEYGKE